VPEGYMPQQETIDAIKAEFPWLGSTDLEREHRSFMDYWVAVAGQKGTKLDWDATWRNWMRRQFRNHPGSGRRSQFVETLEQGMDLGERLALEAERNRELL
jgi:hypothetical protein